MNLKLRTLHALANRMGYPATEAALLIDLRVGQPDHAKPSAGDLRSAMTVLEAEGAITGTANPDLGTRWIITDAGTLRLREAGL